MKDNHSPAGIGTIRETSPSTREVDLEIPAEEVSRELERILDEYTSKAKIHGFRKGKAPRQMVKRMFYPDIRSSMIDRLAPGAVQHALRGQNVNPVSIPVIKDLHFEEGQPLHFTAHFEVIPEFDLPLYKKIKVKGKEVAVEPKEIDEAVEELRQKSAEYVPVEGRGVVDGDYVVVEIKGKDLKTTRFLPTEKVVVLAGFAENEQAVNENLSGMFPQEERTFMISYAKDHSNRKLAGKDIDYGMKVITIKEKRLPDINDDFAKTLGEYDDLESLRAKINEQLQKSKESTVRKEKAEEIIRKISDQIPLELPQTLVEQEYVALMKKILSSSSPQALSQADVEKLKSEVHKQAEQNIKRHLILMKIASKESLNVTDEDVDSEIKEIALRNNLPLARVVDSINQEGRREELRDSLLLRKTVDFLIEQAIIE